MAGSMPLAKRPVDANVSLGAPTRVRTRPLLACRPGNRDAHALADRLRGDAAQEIGFLKALRSRDGIRIAGADGRREQG
jgi:hypothetical protein